VTVSYLTADLCDEFSTQLKVAEPVFQHYGAKATFGGPALTIKLFEDNSLVREILEEPGEGRVMVVDGGGSTRCALVGGRLAQLALDKGWAGLVVYGCIRDSVEISEIDIGIKALNTHPLKSVKRGLGDRDVEVSFAGVTIAPGSYIYADADGVVVSEVPLGGQA